MEVRNGKQPMSEEVETFRNQMKNGRVCDRCLLVHALHNWGRNIPNSLHEGSKYVIIDKNIYTYELKSSHASFDGWISIELNFCSGVEAEIQSSDSRTDAPAKRFRIPKYCPNLPHLHPSYIHTQRGCYSCTRQHSIFIRIICPTCVFRQVGLL